MFTRSHVVGRWPPRASSAVSRVVTMQPVARRALPGFAIARHWLERQRGDAGSAFRPDIENDEDARAAALRAAGALFDVDVTQLDARVVGRSQSQVSIDGGGFSAPTINTVLVDVRSRHEGVVIDHADVRISFDRAGLQRMTGAPAVCAVVDPRLVEIGTADEAVDRALQLLSKHPGLQGREDARFMPTTVGPRYLGLDVDGHRVSDVAVGTPLRAGWRLEFETDFARIVVRFEVDGDHRVEVGFMDGC